jgi:Domain of unknown function (DUF3291)
MTRFHLAQVNVAMPREPVESPLLADFVAALDPINQIADTSPGFVWRLQTEAGNATSLRWPTNDGTLVNMSVWESVEALSDFVYRSAHVDVMKQRRKWFETMQLYMVLWWIPRGHIPTLEEAHERLQHLRDHGPTRHAFTFRQPFAAPDTGREVAPRDEDRCPSP